MTDEYVYKLSMGFRLGPGGKCPSCGRTAFELILVTTDARIVDAAKGTSWAGPSKHAVEVKSATCTSCGRELTKY